MIYSSRTRFLVLLLIVTILGAACNLPLLSNPEAGGEDGSFDPIDLSDGDGQDAREGNQSSGEEAPALDDGSMADFRCPDTPEAYELQFDHDVKFDTPGFGSWDLVTSGVILLSVAEGLSEGTVYMPFRPGEVIVPGTVFANFGRGEQICSFEGEMEVIVNIDGNCDRGVVHLNIVENWGDVDTSMTCCTGEDCDTFPFQWMLPVIQYTDVQFSAANGFQVTKPFAGGEGQLMWTLTTPVEPVPLTD